MLHYRRLYPAWVCGMGIQNTCLGVAFGTICGMMTLRSAEPGESYSPSCSGWPFNTQSRWFSSIVALVAYAFLPVHPAHGSSAFDVDHNNSTSCVNFPFATKAYVRNPWMILFAFNHFDACSCPWSRGLVGFSYVKQVSPGWETRLFARRSPKHINSQIPHTAGVGITSECSMRISSSGICLQDLSCRIISVPTSMRIFIRQNLDRGD